MSVPPIPAPLDQLRQRRFSFYPSIVNIEHNEWVVRCATWGEVQVMNTKTGIEIWIPLRLLGEALNLMRNEMMNSVTPVGWPALSKIMLETIGHKIPLNI